MHTVKQNELKYSELLSFGKENDLVVDWICAALLALCPILQHYKGLFVDASTTILVLIFPWLLFRFLFKSTRINLSALYIVLPLIVLNIYKSVIHEISLMYLAYGLAMAFYYAMAALGHINMKCVIRVASCIAMVASILIIIQYICFYIFGFHLQLVATSQLLPRAEQWILGAQTGLAGITGKLRTSFYRPSAFFLEPSHMFLYIFPHIFIMLFSKNISKWKIQRAVLLSVGLVLSTSGMGVLAVAGAWGAYFAFSNGKENRMQLKSMLRAKNLIMVIFLIIIIVALVLYVPFIHRTVMRFLNMSERGAIAGRTSAAWELIRSLRGMDLLVGVTRTSNISFNMPGFADTLYRYGILGVVMSYSVYVTGLIKLKYQYAWISFLIIITSFFSAHTHGTFYMLYYVFIILEGNYSQRKARKERVEE